MWPPSNLKPTDNLFFARLKSGRAPSWPPRRPGRRAASASSPSPRAATAPGLYPYFLELENVGPLIFSNSTKLALLFLSNSTRRALFILRNWIAWALLSPRNRQSGTPCRFCERPLPKGRNRARCVERDRSCPGMSAFRRLVRDFGRRGLF